LTTISGQYARERLINVFIWPANKRDDFPDRLLEDEGFRIMFWDRGGLNFCSISDLSAAEFSEFVGAYQS
jgi:hypothetical protein